MAVSNISFTCQQCGKKFNAPAAAAGKTVNCSCGARVAVPSGGAPSPAVQVQQPAAASPQPVFPASQPATPNMTGATSFPAAFAAPAPSTMPAAGGRREFPSLNAVARILVVLSWIYIVGGILGGLLLIGAALNARGDAVGPAIGGTIGLAIVVAFAVIFLRASAEIIRLALYIAELLEDIRAK
jgi:DNA-directed RNA polymerase subunit RPC12/RpoP